MKCGLSDMRHVLLMFAARMHASAFVWAPIENSNAYLLFRKSITKIKSVLKFQNNSVLTRYTYWQCVVVTSNALSCLMLRMMRDQLNKNIISSDFESRKSAKTHLKPAKQNTMHTEKCTKQNHSWIHPWNSWNLLISIRCRQFACAKTCKFCELWQVTSQKSITTAKCGHEQIKLHLKRAI